MEIAALTSAATGQSATRGVTSDYNTFLRMLTVQMQNQDPLNPIDSADYAVQLATFSGVEQQTRMNQTLETMLGRFDLLGLGQLAGWVGNQVLSGAPVGFDGTPVAMDLPAVAGADRGVLVVEDAAGNEVARTEVPTEGGPWTWEGAAADGDTLAAGTYRLSLEYYTGEALAGTARADTWQEVSEVAMGSAGLVLRLAGGTDVMVSDVLALRAGG